jgi:hypothetical protein
MSFRLKSFRRASAKSIIAIAAVFFLSVWLTALAPGAAAAGLFVGMDGKWRGEGSITWSTGETERMRCNATYKVENEGNKLTQNLTCATDSTRLVIKSTITFNPDAGAISGTWSEMGYGINGSVTGRASQGSIQALVETPDDRFTARVTVLTRGSDQTVSIKPDMLEVTDVSVKLRRAG